MEEKLKISVDFYNDAEKALFQKYPNVVEINKIIGEGIEISKDEFMGYMMFVDQMDRDGFRTYEELRERISKRIGDIDDFLYFDNESIQSIMSSSEMHQSRYTERIGVALGLCIINRIHGLTSADWKKIPETFGYYGHPTFDFDLQMASTGCKYIQVENKGSVVLDNSSSNVVKNHYSGDHGILKKKKYIREEEEKKQIPLHQNLYYGTIGVLDNSNKAKVWLVDPAAFEIDLDPMKYKLLARLHYYLDEFKNVEVKKSITDALEQRINMIAESDNYLSLNNKPLLAKYVKSSYTGYMQKKNFSIVDTNEAFGKTYIVEKGNLKYCYLNALPKTLMRIIVNQDFEEILKYNYNPDFINDKVQVLIRTTSEMKKEFNLVEDLDFIYNERSKISEAVFHGRVFHTNDGRIFGLLGYETGGTPSGNKLLNSPPGVLGNLLNIAIQEKKQEQKVTDLDLLLSRMKLKQ